MKDRKNPLALLPLVVFLALFLGSGIYFNSKGVEFAFYQLPSPVAAIAGITVAFILFKGSLEEKMESFINGVGDSNIIIMCMIYLLAGAFSTVANAMGGVDSTVNFGLSVIPPSMILPGLFVIAAFVSTAMGTSMGTIAAICPIAVDMAVKAQIPLAIAVGTVVSGAMFGDNLSMISDTTIAATRTQGCAMKDKFIMNFKIALPAALITIAILAFTGITGHIPQGLEYNFVKILPYVSVLVLALLGINVFLVLLIGIILAGAIGLADGSFTLISFTQKMYEGFGTMQEIFILSLLIGGLAAMIAKEGGIDYLLDFISHRIRSRKGAELGIGALVSVADICTANNTVAIVITGPMARKLAEENGVDPRRSASMLDIFSCIWQGIIPYGAQLLLAGSIAKLSPVQIMPNLYYPYLLGLMALAAIAFGFPRAD
ncbi:Na+/H+ antiporter NhaC family protein [Thermosediminibacter litoriperuensis]|uniref:Putative methionine transporter, NhaC family (TC 2.A.35.1.-) n=1 Tax=Thermosediminibacter litoriperuensis TaxID=291989 RepID=A0A5S5AZ60_9FIRM|nr:Na+/H+ antiporter NhaC family protein [Thermosediminibacter litoriperuensis]TYP58565.1 putative methionine transporter, NhaC family (TC 2.A.35.1.-) [Thermosediminibacter litoriperuensis]